MHKQARLSDNTIAALLPTFTSGFMCVALIRPRSQIASEWKFEKPTYCIYEYDPIYVEKHEIRFGDGSWHRLDESHLTDIILLMQFGEDALTELFD